MNIANPCGSRYTPGIHDRETPMIPSSGSDCFVALSTDCSKNATEREIAICNGVSRDVVFFFFILGNTRLACVRIKLTTG